MNPNQLAKQNMAQNMPVQQNSAPFKGGLLGGINNAMGAVGRGVNGIKNQVVQAMTPNVAHADDTLAPNWVPTMATEPQAGTTTPKYTLILNHRTTLGDDLGKNSYGYPYGSYDQGWSGYDHDSLISGMSEIDRLGRLSPITGPIGNRTMHQPTSDEMAQYWQSSPDRAVAPNPYDAGAFNNLTGEQQSVANQYMSSIPNKYENAQRGNKNSVGLGGMWNVGFRAKNR